MTVRYPRGRHFIMFYKHMSMTITTSFCHIFHYAVVNSKQESLVVEYSLGVTNEF